MTNMDSFSYEEYRAYYPVEYSTPTKSAQSTPVSTPTKVALLKSKILARGSPIKFSLSTPEKQKLKDNEFDLEEDEFKKSKFCIGRRTISIALWLLWLLLIASSIYLSVVYIQSAALGILRWSNSLKTLFRLGLVVVNLSTGFAVGSVILRLMRIPSSPWHISFDEPRRLIWNWLMFIILLIGLPVALTVQAFVLGRSGNFNPEYQAWNNACLGSQFNSMIQMTYISVIGNQFNMNIYARDSSNDAYRFLGYFPVSAPNQNSLQFNTPSFILYPSTNPISADAAAGQAMFALTNSSTVELIANLQLNVTETGGQSILGQCISTTDSTANLTNCIDGFLTSSAQVLQGDVGSNPFLRTVSNETKTVQIMYDTFSNSVDSNSTFLLGYSSAWPSEGTQFMNGQTAANQQPSGILEEIDSNGNVVNEESVQVITSPWPGCYGIKVCGTSGLNAMIAAGWIWENLDNWMWYSPENCWA